MRYHLFYSMALFYASLSLLATQTPDLLPTAYADDLEAWLDQQAAEGFEAAAAIGSEQMMRAMGGVQVGGVWYPPGTDWDRLTTSTLGGTGRPAFTAVPNLSQGPPLFFSENPNDASYQAANRRSINAESDFKTKRDAALSELTALCNTLITQSRPHNDLNNHQSDDDAVDYLPSTRIRFQTAHNTHDAQLSAGNTPQVDDRPTRQGTDINTWIAEAATTASDNIMLVHGLIEPRFAHLCTIATSTKDLSLASHIDLFGEQQAEVAHEAEADERITLSLPSDAFFDTAVEAITQLTEELHRARHSRRSNFRPNPASTYRWVFDQLLNHTATSYTPYEHLMYRNPKIRLAIVGTPTTVNERKSIQIKRLLFVPTPIPSHSGFIAERKGVPATLIDESGRHEIAFIECKVASSNTRPWLDNNPAIRAVNEQPDEYVRALLLASVADIEEMNARLRDEIDAVTCADFERCLAESNLDRLLRAANYDRRKLSSATRFLANGLASKVLHELIALCREPSRKKAAITGLAQLRARMTPYLRDAGLSAFINAKVLPSFLVLVVDQEGVSLCDCSSALDLHYQYAMAWRGPPEEDSLTVACRLAELRCWVALAQQGVIVSPKPPFSELPTGDTAKHVFLDSLSVRFAEACEGAGIESINIEGRQPSEENVKGQFSFPTANPTP